MQFVTPATPDSIPSFCSLLEKYKAHVKRKNIKRNWVKAVITQKTWAKAYYRARASEAQNHRCCYCGVVMITEPDRKTTVTLEHVKCRSHGGTDHPANYAAACRKCNGSRRDTPLEDFLNKIGLTCEPVLL